MTEQDLHLIQLQTVKQLYRKQMLIFGVIILIAGVVIGIGSTTVYYAADKPVLSNSNKLTDDEIKGLEYINEAALRSLRFRLHLSPEQTQQVQGIYNNHMAALAKIREDVRPLIAETLNSLNENMLAVLDDNQDMRWNDVIDELARMFDPRDDNGMNQPNWNPMDPSRGGSRGGNRGGFSGMPDGGRGEFGSIEGSWGPSRNSRRGGPFDFWANQPSDLVDPNYVPRLLRRGGGSRGMMPGTIPGTMPGTMPGGGFGGSRGGGGMGMGGFGGSMGGFDQDQNSFPSGFGGMGGGMGMDGFGGSRGGGMGGFDQDQNNFPSGFRGMGMDGFGGSRGGGMGGFDQDQNNFPSGFGGMGSDMGMEGFGGGRRGMGGFGMDPNSYPGFGTMPPMEGFNQEPDDNQ